MNNKRNKKKKNLCFFGVGNIGHKSIYDQISSLCISYPFIYKVLPQKVSPPYPTHTHFYSTKLCCNILLNS